MKTRKFGKGLLALFVAAVMLLGLGTTAQAADQTSAGSEGIVAMHIDGSSPGNGIALHYVQYVDYDFGGFDTHGYQQAADLGVYPQYVYCINPTKNPGADANKNQHFRWRWNLNANAYIFDNNRGQLENTEYAPDSSQLAGLAAIIYYGEKNGYSYGAIQDAVYWYVCYGNGSAPDYAGQSYRNEITEAYEAGTATAPASYGLYMYVADSEVTEVVQNTIGLAVWSEEETKTEPAVENTTAKVNGTATEVELKSGEEGTFTDEVTLKDLEEGKEYTVVSTLYKDGEEFDSVTSTATGTSLTVTFNKKVTEAGEYKVKTELKDGDTVVQTHNGDLDVASETVKVTVPDESTDEPTEGKIATTVTADGTKASASAAAAIEAGTIKVTDTIAYENLIGGATYKVDGVLYEVVDGKEGSLVASSQSTECVADASGKGTWEITISEAVSLDAGKTYVVYETAQLVKDADGNDVTDGETYEHKDPTDVAQTIVVKSANETPKSEEPEKPTTPENTKPDNDTPTNDTPKNDNKTTTPTTSKTTTKTTSPKTADTASVVLWIGILLLIAGAAVLVTGKRRRA